MQTVSTCCAMFDPCLLPWPLPSRAGGERKGKESSPVLCEAPARTPPLCASCCSCCICVSALLRSNYFFPVLGSSVINKKKLFQFPPPVLAPVLFSFLLEHTALFFSYEVLLPSSLEYKLIFGLDEPTHGLLYGRKEGKNFVLNT